MADLVFNIAKGKTAYYCGLPAAADGLVLVLLDATGLEADATLKDYDNLSALLAGTSNPPTAAQQSATFGASGGVVSLSGTVSFTGGAASGPVTYVSLWAGATYRGSQPIETGDLTFNAAGAYDLTALSITGSATN
jgi:hypothetical protein